MYGTGHYLHICYQVYTESVNFVYTLSSLNNKLCFNIYLMNDFHKWIYSVLISHWNNYHIGDVRRLKPKPLQILYTSITFYTLQFIILWLLICAVKNIEFVKIIVTFAVVVLSVGSKLSHDRLRRHLHQTPTKIYGGLFTNTHK